MSELSDKCEPESIFMVGPMHHKLIFSLLFIFWPGFDPHSNFVRGVEEERSWAYHLAADFEILEKLGVEAGSSDEKEEIINLLTYSEPLVIT